MTEHYPLPVIVVNKQKWGALSYLGHHHDICGETCHVIDQKFSFAGGHRVRLYRISNNVHWRIPGALVADIQNVAPASAPLRRRHHKG
jgi:hypothetical protein